MRPIKLEPRRTFKIQLRLSAAELQVVRRLSRRLGAPMSESLRVAAARLDEELAELEEGRKLASGE